MSGPTVLIMAAGEGTRMRSSLPKVLHPVCGRPMVAWPVLAAREAGAGRVAVIVSPDRDLAPGLPEGTETVIQPEADGTGGAVRAAHDLVRDSETVVVLSGDHPLINGEIVAELLETHRAAGAGATVMTVELDDPGAYGRIVRDADGDIERIVETKNPEEVEPEVLAIREINTGTYVFDAEPLMEALDQLDNDNSAGEYYLGDVLPMLRDAGRRVVAHLADGPERQPRRQQPRRPRRRHRRGPAADPRAPHARRGHGHRPGLDLDRRRRRDRRRRDDRARHARCAARPASAPTRSSARTRP